MVRRFLGYWWVRLIIGAVLVFALSAAGLGLGNGIIDGVRGTIVERGPAEMSLLGASLAALAGLAIYAFHLRWVERQPRVDIGFKDDGRNGSALREIVLGLAIGAGLMALVTTVIALAGSYEITAVNSVSAILPALAIGVFAGVVEEILLRGLFFRLLEEWAGSVIALAASALLFGFLHGTNANASLFSSFAIALEAGVLLGLAYMFTRRLWMVIGIHMAWNTTLGGVFGMPVSGYPLPSILEADINGPDLLTGGAFGPEASLTAISICGIAAAAFAWSVTRRGEWRRAGWRRRETRQGVAAVFDS